MLQSLYQLYDNGVECHLLDYIVSGRMNFTSTKHELAETECVNSFGKCIRKQLLNMLLNVLQKQWKMNKTLK